MLWSSVAAATGCRRCVRAAGWPTPPSSSVCDVGRSHQMSSHKTSKIFVVGGTGAQGIPIIRALVADQKYSVRFLTRDSASRRAEDLLALNNVSVLEGSLADESILREGFRGCDGAFINIDGF